MVKYALALWNWIFRAGLAIALVGAAWTLWPAPGAHAYASANRFNRSYYHHGPRVAIDLGHFNDSPADSRFLALADLLNWDGYRANRSKQYLVPEYLKDIPVLVIGNPRPYPFRLAGTTAFAPEEITAVRDWVQAGGSLLLEATIPRSARAAAPLAEALGFAFRECPSPVFVPQVQLTRNRAETVAALVNGWIEAPSTNLQAAPLLVTPPDAATCAAGKPLALAFEFGRGRVVGLSAQLERDEALIRRTGIDPRNAGNRQFLLDTMHWLSRAEEQPQ